MVDDFPQDHYLLLKEFNRFVPIGDLSLQATVALPQKFGLIVGKIVVFGVYEWASGATEQPVTVQVLKAPRDADESFITGLGAAIQDSVELGGLIETQLLAQCIDGYAFGLQNEFNALVDI